MLKYNNNLNINGLYLNDLKQQSLYYRKDNTGSTEFIYTRFLVPYLNNYQGWALFCDSDFLWFCDPTEILEKYRNVMYGDLWIDYLSKEEYNKLLV
jgi:hypothetical protein